MMERSGATLRWTILPLGGDIAMKTATPYRPTVTGVRKILGSTYVENFALENRYLVMESALAVINTYVETHA